MGFSVINTDVLSIILILTYMHICFNLTFLNLKKNFLKSLLKTQFTVGGGHHPGLVGIRAGLSFY